MAKRSYRQTFTGALTSLSAELPRLRGEAARARIFALRRLAVTEGLHPAAAIADDFAAALACDGSSTPIRCWIEALQLAATCEAQDRATRPLLLATIGARLSS